MSMRVYKIGRKIGIGEMEVGVVVLGLIEVTWKFTVKAMEKSTRCHTASSENFRSTANSLHGNGARNRPYKPVWYSKML